MDHPLLEQTVESLKKNKFKVYVADDPEQAKGIIINEVLPEIGPGLVSYGDSETLFDTGALGEIKAMSGKDGWQFLDTFEEGVERAEILQRRRDALQADIFFTGSNALTAKGQLVNLDMVGNRVGGIVWGPHHVVLTIGTNKLVEDLDQAMSRIREIAAPKNAARHNCKTPCAKTGKCLDCNSPERICNVWTITEKSWPAGRISVVLIKGDYGL
ncbi:lactate utilization protein [Maridesulfovibrio sp.]|uniref:lactate utilization protein n=1 Tax=Maridesulfovibrio sp. TaxID=2795000 RepID=UPI003BACA9EC